MAISLLPAELPSFLLPAVSTLIGVDRLSAEDSSHWCELLILLFSEDFHRLEVEPLSSPSWSEVFCFNKKIDSEMPTSHSSSEYVKWPVWQATLFTYLFIHILTN